MNFKLRYTFFFLEITNFIPFFFFFTSIFIFCYFYLCVFLVFSVVWSSKIVFLLYFWISSLFCLPSNCGLTQYSSSKRIYIMCNQSKGNNCSLTIRASLVETGSINKAYPSFPFVTLNSLRDNLSKALPPHYMLELLTSLFSTSPIAILPIFHSKWLHELHFFVPPVQIFTQLQPPMLYPQSWVTLISSVFQMWVRRSTFSQEPFVELTPACMLPSALQSWPFQIFRSQSLSIFLTFIISTYYYLLFPLYHTPCSLLSFQL